MKKIFWAVLAAFLILGACATMQQGQQHQPIAMNDLPVLKGHWEGQRNIIIQRGTNLNYAEMDILNDTVPLRGTLTLHLESGAAGHPGADIRRYPFADGVINPNGNLEVNLPEDNMMSLSFRGADKKTLYGVFRHRGNQGTITLRKKS